MKGENKMSLLSSSSLSSSSEAVIARSSSVSESFSAKAAAPRTTVSDMPAIEKIKSLIEFEEARYEKIQKYTTQKGRSDIQKYEKALDRSKLRIANLYGFKAHFASFGHGATIQTTGWGEHCDFRTARNKGFSSVDSIVITQQDGSSYHFQLNSSFSIQKKKKKQDIDFFPAGFKQYNNNNYYYYDNMIWTGPLENSLLYRDHEDEDLVYFQKAGFQTISQEKWPVNVFDVLCKAKNITDQADQPEYSYFQSRAYCAIAAVLEQSDPDTSSHLFHFAIELADQTKDPYLKSKAYCNIATALAKSELAKSDSDKVKQLLLQMEQNVMTFAKYISEPDLQIECYCEIATALVKSDPDRSSHLFHFAIELADQTKDPYLKSEAHLKIVTAEEISRVYCAAQKQAESKLDDANQLFLYARKIADEMGNLDDKIKAYGVIAQKQAESNLDEANRLYLCFQELVEREIKKLSGLNPYVLIEYYCLDIECRCEIAFRQLMDTRR